ncbi:MAG: TraR/DksA family transcriptional regulator [Candidatus Roizmanbacteria bacterium]
MPTSLDQKTIQELKNLLLTKRAKHLKEVEELKKEDPFSDPDHAIGNADVASDVQDDIEHSNVEAQISALQENLFLLELALQKMEQGIYGICEKTGQEIPLARLKLVPEARTIVM